MGRRVTDQKSLSGPVRWTTRPVEVPTRDSQGQVVRDPDDLRAQPLVRVTDREQIAVGHRGQKVGYLPDIFPTHPESFLGRTTAVALRRTAVSPLPRGATAVRVMIAIASNTANGGSVSFLAYASESRGAAGGIANAAAVFRANMTNANHVWSSTLDVPLVNGNVLWEATISNSPNYDINMYITAVLSE